MFPSKPCSLAQIDVFFHSLVLLLLSPIPDIFAERNHISLWPLFFLSEIGWITQERSPKFPTHLHVISPSVLKIISVFPNHSQKAWNYVFSMSCSSGRVKLASVCSPNNVPITFFTAGCHWWFITQLRSSHSYFLPHWQNSSLKVRSL